MKLSQGLYTYRIAGCVVDVWRNGEGEDFGTWCYCVNDGLVSEPFSTKREALDAATQAVS